jgi:hypothetical protein
LTAPYFVAAILDFYHGIEQFALTDIAEHRLEELALKTWRHVRNNNHETCVERRLLIERKKVRAVVGDEGVVLLEDNCHQFPVFRTPQAEIVDMIGEVTRRVCQFQQRCVQALVNEKFRHYFPAALGYSATWMGFCFAHG